MRIKGYKRECGESVHFFWGERSKTLTVVIDHDSEHARPIKCKDLAEAMRKREAWEAEDRAQYRRLVEENLRVESGTHKWEPSPDGVNCAICDYPVTASTHSED